MDPFSLAEAIDRKLEQIRDLAHYCYQPTQDKKKSDDEADEFSPVERETLEAVSRAFGINIFIKARKNGELVSFRHG